MTTSRIRPADAGCGRPGGSMNAGGFAADEPSAFRVFYFGNSFLENSVPWFHPTLVRFGGSRDAGPDATRPRLAGLDARRHVLQEEDPDGAKNDLDNYKNENLNKLPGKIGPRRRALARSRRTARNRPRAEKDHQRHGLGSGPRPSLHAGQVACPQRRKRIDAMSSHLHLVCWSIPAFNFARVGRFRTGATRTWDGSADTSETKQGPRRQKRDRPGFSRPAIVASARK